MKFIQGDKVTAEEVAGEIKRVAPRRKRSVRDRNRQFIRATVKQCMDRLVEQKHVTTSVSQAPCPLSGHIDCLNILSQGSSASTRLGNQVRSQYLDVYGSIQLPSSGGNSDFVRLIFFIDHEPLGALPAVSDVLESSIAISPFNHDKVNHVGQHGSRFTILGERMIEVQNSIASTGTVDKPWHFRCKLNSPTLYQSGAGTISDLLRNSVCVLQISDLAWANCYYRAEYCFSDA